MARKRQVANPAQVRAQTAALAAVAAAGLSAQGRRIRRRLTTALLCLLAAALLMVSFAPFDCWPLAYVALVPWLVVLRGDARRYWPVLCVWGAGLVFWLAAAYWLSWITLLGYVLAAFYLSLDWLVAALLLRSALRRNWPMWIVLPVVWLSLEYLRAFLLGGFPWFHLSQSQYAQTRLIQIADVTGEYGVSFFVAMVNGAAADLLNAALFSRPGESSRPRPTPVTGFVPSRVAPVPGGKPTLSSAGETPATHRARQGLVGAAACGAAAAAMLLYGTWRMNENTQSPGPVIGIVQQAYPIALGRPAADANQIEETHLEAALTLAGKGCDLVLIPESMLVRGLNADFLTQDFARMPLKYVEALAERVYSPADRLEYSDRYLIEKYYLPFLKDKAARVGQASRRLGCPILAGDSALRHNPAPTGKRDLWLKYNSALWFDGTAGAATSGPSAATAQAARPLWESSRRYYSKVHLVPFSEAVPWRDFWPALHRYLRTFVPEVMEQLEPGTEFVVYDLVRPALPGAEGARPAASRPAATAATGPAPRPSPAPARTWRLAAPICYEGTFSGVCRDMVWQNDRKSVDILANLSNDGWFVWQRGGGRVHRSTEHAQHLAHYCFRAVENRVPVVRAVNTGISASVDSCGRIVAELRRGPLRSMIAGNLLLDGRTGSEDSIQHGPLVLVDSRWSVYSRVGDAFAALVSACGAALSLYLVLRRPRPVEGAKR